MNEYFWILKPYFDVFLPILAIVQQIWAVITDPEIVVTTLWILAWATALVVGLHHLGTVRADWHAVVVQRIFNGRRLIARGNLRTMWLLVGVSILNIVPGVVALLFRPGGLISADVAGLINRTALLLSAWMVTAIILGKRSDRSKWDAAYTPQHSHDQ